MYEINPFLRVKFKWELIWKWDKVSSLTLGAARLWKHLPKTINGKNKLNNNNKKKRKKKRKKRKKRKKEKSCAACKIRPLMENFLVKEALNWQIGLEFSSPNSSSRELCPARVAWLLHEESHGSSAPTQPHLQGEISDYLPTSNSELSHDLDSGSFPPTASHSFINIPFPLSNRNFCKLPQPVLIRIFWVILHQQQIVTYLPPFPGHICSSFGIGLHMKPALQFCFFFNKLWMPKEPDF